jgi:hypothetical protein
MMLWVTSVKLVVLSVLVLAAMVAMLTLPPLTKARPSS